MFDRLKSLPLTIILTVLIWMYAESQVNSFRSDASVTVAKVPVWVSGPPGVLAKYDVALDPAAVSVKVSGPPAQIDSMRNIDPSKTGIHVYLDITEQDQPTAVMLSRLVRYAAPEGITISQVPERVGFRLTPTVGAATGK